MQFLLRFFAILKGKSHIIHKIRIVFFKLLKGKFLSRVVVHRKHHK